MPIDPSAVGRAVPVPRYEVSREKIREFAEAIGDANPAFLDPDVAHAYGHDNVVAPPTFAIIPVMRGLDVLLAELSIAFSRVVHVDQRFAYRRAILAGDQLDTTATLDSVRSVAGNDMVTITCTVRADANDVCVAGATLLIRPEIQGGGDDA